LKKLETTISIKNNTLVLIPEKAIFWQEEKALIVADLHIGKANHFRKSGLAVPEAANKENFEKLLSCMMAYKPEKVIFAGDLFHSAYNQAWEEVGEFLQNYKHIQFYLTVGNHDVLSLHQYEKFGLHVVERYSKNGIEITHHPEILTNGNYNLAGHIHPGFRLTGKAKQTITLPCFYFGEKNGILPAFGTFTGLSKIEIKDNDQLYVITNQTILKVA
jgi:DNA ligase-associated metallophosphoesterase